MPASREAGAAKYVTGTSRLGDSAILSNATSLSTPTNPSFSEALSAVVHATTAAISIPSASKPRQSTNSSLDTVLTSSSASSFDSEVISLASSLSSIASSPEDSSDELSGRARGGASLAKRSTSPAASIASSRSYSSTSSTSSAHRLQLSPVRASPAALSLTRTPSFLGASSAVNVKEDQTLLSSVFAAEASAHALPAMPVELPFAPEWRAAVVVHDEDEEERTLVVSPSAAESGKLLDAQLVVDILEHAEQQGCAALVIALSKTDEALADLLHSLMYVGGTVCASTEWITKDGWIAVGLEV